MKCISETLISLIVVSVPKLTKIYLMSCFRRAIQREVKWKFVISFIFRIYIFKSLLVKSQDRQNHQHSRGNSWYNFNQDELLSSQFNHCHHQHHHQSDWNHHYFYQLIIWKFSYMHHRSCSLTKHWRELEKAASNSRTAQRALVFTNASFRNSWRFGEGRMECRESAGECEASRETYVVGSK